MQAIIIKRYGGPEVLEFSSNAEKPRPVAGQLLVKIHACALNPVDFKIREGHLQELFAVKFPRILGGDISGVVEEMGPGTTDFKVGDEVFFANPLDKDGGYAEYVAVDQTIVAKKPRSSTYVEAASLPVVGLTAIQALRDFGDIKAGSKVLIHAGAGGVGTFAIQYAKYCGATVFTTVSEEKKELAKKLGADRTIDYQKENFVEICQQEGGMDIVLETVGGTSYPRSIAAAREGGAVPCIVNPPDSDSKALSEQKNIKTDFLLLNGNRKDLNEIARLVEEGIIRPNVFKVLPLKEAKAGNELLASGRAQGKVVLKII